MLNETGSDVNEDIISLKDFLNSTKYLNIFRTISKQLNLKILLNICFQVLYTLEVFNRIGLKHNDLHGNILLLIKKDNIFNGKNIKINRLYTWRDAKCLFRKYWYRCSNF